MIVMDEDALHAAVDLAGRAGARDLELGYLHDGVPTEQAGWWAQANIRGTRVIVEDQPGPVPAAEALAEKLLAGGLCTHCQGLITLFEDGAIVYTGDLADGSEMTVQRARYMSQCRWHRMGATWHRGCEATHPDEPAPRPNRATRRRKGRPS